MERTNAIDIYLLLFAGTLVLLMLAAAVVLFIYLYRRRLSQQQVALHEMHTRLQLDILKSNIEALETERKRFAADLHDEIGGKLSALRLHLTQLQKKGDDSNDLQLLVARSKDIIDTMIGTVRRISHNMLPPSLEMFGLANAVEELCAWVNTSSALRVHIDYRLQHVLLDQKKELALYRIIQELLSNTIRHAHASTVHLSLSPAASTLQLIYKDDGRGFDPLQKNTQVGLGFRNIENRVKVIRGTIQYSGAGQGFQCIICFSEN